MNITLIGLSDTVETWSIGSEIKPKQGPRQYFFRRAADSNCFIWAFCQGKIIRLPSLLGGPKHRERALLRLGIQWINCLLHLFCRVD